MQVLLSNILESLLLLSHKTECCFHSSLCLSVGCINIPHPICLYNRSRSLTLCLYNLSRRLSQSVCDGFACTHRTDWLSVLILTSSLRLRIRLPEEIATVTYFSTVHLEPHSVSLWRLCRYAPHRLAVCHLCFLVS